MYTYRAHGLRIEVPFSCPELTPDGESVVRPWRAPDVVVRFGDPPQRIADPGERGAAFEASVDEVLLAVPRIGRFHVRAGNAITISPDDGASEDALRVMLLGSCLGAVLHQRGVLALHASAVRADRGAVVMLGESGAGKSTLAAALAQRGPPVLGDDLVAVGIDASGVPHMLPGVRQLRLWADAAEQLAVDTRGLRPIRDGLEKFGVPATSAIVDEPIPLHRAYELVPGNDRTLHFEVMGDAERFAALARHTYRYRFLGGPARRAAHFGLATRTAARLPVTRVRRPQHTFLLDELVDRVMADIG